MCGLQFHRRLSLLTTIVRRCASELFHFLLVALLFVLGYAFIGWQSYGPRIEEMHTFDRAVSIMVSVHRHPLGAFDGYS